MKKEESRPLSRTAHQEVCRTTTTIPRSADIVRVLDSLWADDRETIEAFIASIATTERDIHRRELLGVAAEPPDSPHEYGTQRDTDWKDGWIAARVHQATRADEVSAALDHIERPTHEQMVARRIAEMEASARKRGQPDWPGKDNMTLPERRAWWNNAMAEWEQHTTSLRGAA